MINYGFVYIWRDKGKNRWYVGAHWVTKENDRYVCSSTWMRNSYKRRPNDFRRKVIFTCFEKNVLWNEEFRILSFIKEGELGKKYYNFRIQHHDLDNKPRVYSTLSDEMKLQISNKLKGIIPWNKGIKWTEEQKKGLKGRPSGNKGRHTTEETREKQRLAKLGKKRGHYNKRKPKCIIETDSINEMLIH